MKTDGFTIWLTGLPCSGKSTLATKLATQLKSMGRQVEILDGDEVRQRLTKDLGFSKEDRDENVRRIGYVAELLSRNGVVVIVAVISPYRQVREELKKDIERFVEVYVKCGVEVCAARDVKGMYKKAYKGEIQNFTGVSDPYEPPLAPEIIVDTEGDHPDDSLIKLLNELVDLQYVGNHSSPRGNPQSTIAR